MTDTNLVILAQLSFYMYSFEKFTVVVGSVLFWSV